MDTEVQSTDVQTKVILSTTLFDVVRDIEKWAIDNNPQYIITSILTVRTAYSGSYLTTITYEEYFQLAV